mgnify:CR=1 FL=1
MDIEIERESIPLLCGYCEFIVVLCVYQYNLIKLNILILLIINMSNSIHITENNGTKFVC